jgi:hypothetical protein
MRYMKEEHVVEVAAVSTRLVTCTRKKYNAGPYEVSGSVLFAFLFVTLHGIDHQNQISRINIQ